MEKLEHLSLERLLNSLIDNEDPSEKETIKKFILENFSESPQYLFEETMKELADKPDPKLRIINARICARDIAEKLLEGMGTMDFFNIEKTCEERISIGKAHCQD